MVFILLDLNTHHLSADIPYSPSHLHYQILLTILLFHTATGLVPDFLHEKT